MLTNVRQACAFQIKIHAQKSFCFINKAFSKEIMKIERPQNKFLKNRREKNERKYAKKRIHCVSFSEKIKRECYSNLDVENTLDDQIFWKAKTI